MNISTLQKMDVGELKSLKLIIDKLIDVKVASSISEIKVGDIVKINHSKVVGKQFNVIKINRKKIRVKQVNSNTTYNVAMSLIEKI